MKAKKFLFSTGLALSAVVGVSSTAQAASFTTTLGPGSNPPKGDVFLQQLDLNLPGYQPAVFGTSLFTVSDVNIIKNKGTGLGAGGADKGDDANAPFPPKDNLDITDGPLAAAYLGNNNLNNIIDTEDDGFFEFDVTFDAPVATLGNQIGTFAFFERGLNSDIKIQAFGADGTTLIGNSFLLTRNLWEDAGYSIDTTEVGNSQRVGSYGVTLADLGLGVGTSVTKIKLIAENGYNGPDFKVFGANFITVPTTPEPTTILGLGSIAALALVGRRRAKKASL